MEQRNLGRSGLLVSAIGMGCNNFVHRCDFAQSRTVVHKAIDLGITLFDTADVYGNRGGSEDYLGRILGDRRKDVVLATKFGQPMDDAGKLRGGSRRYVMMAVEASLKRLRTDWIDLFQVHRPDPTTPIEETLRALDDLVRQGKVRYIGASNLSGWEIAERHRLARHHGLHHFVSVQNQYSLLARGAEREEIPAMREYGIGLLPFFPLASGLLTGKYKQDQIPAGSRLATPRPHERAFIAGADWPTVERLEKFCAARGRTMLELAVSWLLAQSPVASVIAGATQAEQLEQNAAAGNWKLAADDLKEIDALTRPGGV